MKRSDIQQSPCYFDRYINQVEDLELAVVFQQSQAEIDRPDLVQLNRLGDAVYVEEKWTVKDTFQHLIDANPILAERALRFARNDRTRLTGVDEAVLAANVNAKARSLESLINELKTVRSANALMFVAFDEVALPRMGVASGIQMSALTIGFTILGHQKHHLSNIETKYLPLIA